jgi:dimethylamine/trimethylamine dehydrogenase
VALAEASRDLGGRVHLEAQLPGLSAWGRVKEYREAAIAQLPSVEIYRESPMTADDIVEFGFQHVLVATGAIWRTDGVARFHTTPMPLADGAQVLGPDDLFAGRLPDGKKVVLFDDDHYYLGGVLAEMLAKRGYDVSIVTTGPQVSAWTNNTFEVNRIQRRLIENGVTRITDHAVTRVCVGGVEVTCVYAGGMRTIECDAVVLVTARLPREGLYLDLVGRRDAGELLSVRGIGDVWAPGTIAAAVWSGRRAAEEFDAMLPPNDEVPFRREVTELAPLPLEVLR